MGLYLRGFVGRVVLSKFCYLRALTHAIRMTICFLFIYRGTCASRAGRQSGFKSSVGGETIKQKPPFLINQTGRHKKIAPSEQNKRQWQYKLTNPVTHWPSHLKKHYKVISHSRHPWIVLAGSRLSRFDKILFSFIKKWNVYVFTPRWRRTTFETVSRKSASASLSTQVQRP